MKKFLFLLMFALPVAFGFTAPSQDDTTCSAPSNVHKTASTTSSITFAWDAANGAVQYKMYYVKEGELASSYFYTTSTNYAFSGLSAGKYSFYFATVCGGGVSSFVVIEDNVML